ncbi:MAG TPA: TetR family transcriptional regulator, partial [Firmicutes bacterium]|nr:TetR family transcriptional regulator [Bacillota bacterium]
MDSDKGDVKSRIVSAAAGIVGRRIGVNLTIRELAKKADVNIAAVNYYFNSKDNLMQEVERTFADQFKKINMCLSLEDDLLPEERLFQWAEMLMSYLMEYPGTI